MKKTSISFSVLIPDAESPLSFGVIYGLSYFKEVSIHAISKLRENPIKYSRYISSYIYFEDDSDVFKTIFKIDEQVKKYDIDLIMPVSEQGMRLAVEHKESFRFQERFCILPSKNNFHIANNKAKLSIHMLKNGIKCSKSTIIKAGGVLNDVLVEFPILAKPAENFGGGKGIVRFDNESECFTFFANNNFNVDYLLEEYINGFDLGCSVLCDDGEILAYTIQKGTLFSNIPYSPQIGLEFLYEDLLYVEVEKLVKSLDWKGVANIDIRYDVANKEFKILEINPRFWYTLDASVTAGVNFPYLYCIHSLGFNFEKPEYKFLKYLNASGVVKKLKTNIWFVFRLKFLYNNTELKHVFKDPLLLIRRLFRSFKGVIQNWIRKSNKS